MPDYPPGTPAWVDLNSPDAAASASFYGDLFGWDAVDVGDPEETRGYKNFTLDGKAVAGLNQVPPEQQAQVPPHWMVYVYVDNADETAAKVKDAGGTAFMEPFDVLEAGRMAIFGDPTGAAFGVWQPNQFRGAEYVNRLGGFCWSELHTRDPEKAKEFYSAVFGWDPETLAIGGGAQYTRWHNGDRIIGGMIEIGPDWPAEVPSNWATYFVVESAEDTIAQAEPNGARLVEGPRDIPENGRFAFLVDPQGAMFAIIAYTPEARERNAELAGALGA